MPICLLHGKRLLPQKLWKRLWSFRSVTFWIHGDGAAGSSTWWTGRDMDQRKDPGWPGMISWTPYSWRISITTAWSVLHPEDVAIPVVMLGRQELPLEEGVISGSHFSHHSHQHPRLPEPNHWIIDSPRLLQLIKLPFISAHSKHAPHPVYRSYY